MSVGDRGSKVESHVVRLFKFEPPMCSVHHTADWARACPATRAASCSAADCGRTASARSGCIGSIMRAPSNASYHHRNQPSLEPILPRATKRGCYCGMLVAATTDPRRAALARMTSLWPTLIRRPEVPCTSEKGSDRPCTSSLARIGDTAQSVRASDTSSCRYQHPPAPWQTSSGKKEPPGTLVGNPKFPLYPSVHSTR
jgi:hypothetical protein